MLGATVIEVRDRGLLDHPAVMAWHTIAPENPEPRGIVAASWETDKLSGPWVGHSMERMSFYIAAMAACLRSAGWGN